MTQNTKPPVGSTETLLELQVGAGDVVKIKGRVYCVRQVLSGSVFHLSDDWLFKGETLATLISRATPDHATADAAIAANSATTSPPAHIITHEGREYDLTALETPPFFLPSPVVSALNEWPYGIEKLRLGTWVDAGLVPKLSHFVYRAKPAPVEVRVTCLRYGLPSNFPHETGTCIKLADGSIDWSTWEPLP